MYVPPSFAETDPRVMLLNDATSSIDVRTEEEIHDTLRQMMQGRTTILVAHRRSTLHLAEKTVESHRANILRKLGMRDRVELVRYAIRRGLIEP